MNSFNHYTYCSIGDWLYRIAAGIELDEKIPGYKHIIIKLQPGGDLTFVKASYQSLYGEVKSAWKVCQNILEIEVVIPPNATETVFLPSARLEDVNEEGIEAGDISGITASRQLENGVGLEIGSV